MTQPRIEPQSLRPLVNTLPIWPMAQSSLESPFLGGGEDISNKYLKKKKKKNCFWFLSVPVKQANPLCSIGPKKVKKLTHFFFYYCHKFLMKLQWLRDT